MKQLDASTADRRPSSVRRALFGGLVLAGSAALALFLTCDNTTIPPGLNGASNGLCTYPSGCFVVNTSGPNAGQCDDDGCSSVPKTACRQVFVPDDPVSYQSGSGNQSGHWMPATGQPVPTDWQAVCGWQYTAPSGHKAICATPETVCIARGSACSGTCVHRSSASASDMGLADQCAAGVPPQRRPGAVDGGTQTYCPLTDDICCPAVSRDGGAVDGGAVDGGAVDGAAGDLLPRG